ncbi:hypothetical protein J6590_013146 [Homalodisca vitripennis]|nr:hypothetical protein J6590_013146 [Homalodisca vitripennis]
MRQTSQITILKHERFAYQGSLRPCPFPGLKERIKEKNSGRGKAGSETPGVAKGMETVGMNSKAGPGKEESSSERKKSMAENRVDILDDEALEKDRNIRWNLKETNEGYRGM